MKVFKIRDLKKIIGVTLLMTPLMLFVGCNQTESGKGEVPSTNEPTTKVEAQAIQTTPIVTMKIKDYGTVTLELYPEMAPNTVNNFITLANSGFYDGLIFHRVVPNFVIQGGDPDGMGSGGPGYSIAGEFSSNGYTANTLLHTKGVLSMARAMAADTAGSQFFIMTADNPSLDGQYAAFGKVTEGLDIIEKIGNVETNGREKPLTDVVIESIRVETNGVEVPAVIKVEE